MNDFNLNPNEAEICAFIVEHSPLIYYGELYYDVEDKEQNRLIFKRCLLKVTDTQKETANWVKVPTAGQDSTVHIDTRLIRGVLVKNIDQTEAARYKEVSIKMYSKLYSV